MIERYWGKADESYAGESAWHPLVYHCLDVAAKRPANTKNYGLGELL